MTSSASPESMLARRGAAVGQQAVAVRVRGLERTEDLEVARHDDPALCLVEPPERGDLTVVAMEDARLRGACLGGEVGLPGDEDVRSRFDPATHGAGLPSGHGPLEGVVREAVDLDEDDARFPYHLGVYLPSLPAQDEPLEGTPVLEREESQKGGEDDGGHEGVEDGPAEVVDREPRRYPAHHLHYEAVHQHRDQTRGPHDHLEEEAHEDGPHQEHGDQHGDRDDDGRSEARHGHTRKQSGHQPENEGLDQDDGDEPAHAEEGALPPRVSGRAEL